MAWLMGGASGGSGWSACQAVADVRNTGRRSSITNACLVAATIALAITSYSISARVAAERRQADRLVAANTRLQSDLKGLTAELRVRMRMPQLQRWNDETFGLTPISARQYLADPQLLAAYGEELPELSAPRLTYTVRDGAPALAAPAPRVTLTAATSAPSAARSAAPSTLVARPTPAPAVIREVPREAPREAVARVVPVSAERPVRQRPARERPTIDRPAIERPTIDRPDEAPVDLLRQVAMLGDSGVGH